LANWQKAIKDPRRNATGSFEQTSAFFEGKGIETAGLTSGALMGLDDESRLGRLYAIAAEDEITAFETAFNEILKDNDAEAIVGDLNKIDWTNQEQIIGFQYRLMETYGISEE
jgi:hypothetical protein